MLAAALTEVLNVLPILTKRIGMDGKIVLLLMAIVLGRCLARYFIGLFIFKNVEGTTRVKFKRELSI